jgi:hypothetical protein
MGAAGKSERLIGKSASKEVGSLEEFLKWIIMKHLFVFMKTQ